MDDLPEERLETGLVALLQDVARLAVDESPS
jgi:hypothetical protein